MIPPIKVFEVLNCQRTPQTQIIPTECAHWSRVAVLGHPPEPSCSTWSLALVGVIAFILSIIDFNLSFFFISFCVRAQIFFFPFPVLFTPSSSIPSSPPLSVFVFLFSYCSSSSYLYRFNDILFIHRLSRVPWYINSWVFLGDGVPWGVSIEYIWVVSCGLFWGCRVGEL